MYYKGDLIGRALNRAKREMFRLPGFRVVRGFEYGQALEQHLTRLPPLDARELPVLHELRKRGATLVDIQSMGLPETPAFFAALDKLVPELKAVQPGNGDNSPRLTPKRMMEFPEIYLWGLNERVLALVENYIGLPIRYHGIDVRREIADGKPNDVRQFHIDTEDHRMFRWIIYLNDVGLGEGPFQYIEREDTIGAVKKLHYGSGFVSDSRMETVLPRPTWHEATASARWGACADTCRIFHKAQAPVTKDRYSITLTWTSTTPIKSYPSTPYSDAAYAYLKSRINQRQLEALPAQ
ncbi:MAG TPA: hypothetical protein VH062_30885 [Polyangiaceae bacterium]|jgi:hypothetical protein|nr:hypothetical protein [Polyangiaceae bacterium]